MSVEHIVVKLEPYSEASDEYSASESAPEVLTKELIIIKTEPIVKQEKCEASELEDPISYAETVFGSTLQHDVKVEHLEAVDAAFQNFGEETSPLQPHTSFDRENKNNKIKVSELKTTNGKGKHICQKCEKSFSSNANLQRHLLLHDRKTYTCQLCHKVYTKKGLYERHLLKHSDLRPYKCEDCGKQFKRSSNLFQHKRVHLTVKPFVCDNCQRSFTIKANLLKHQGKSRCKKPMDQPLICHVCHKTFEKTFLLKSHLRRHDTERPYHCDHCSMNFKYKSTLIRHIQIHNDERPFSCTYCNKRFTHSGLLKPHMRTHTGEKPYKCSLCHKYFSHKHNMERHRLRHNRIKNLVCELCNKKFPKESRLKYHMRIHVNEKHFACFVCPKKFSHRQNVLRHYTRKHPNATYECKDTDASIALKIWDAFSKRKELEDSDTPEEILG